SFTIPLRNSAQRSQSTHCWPDYRCGFRAERSKMYFTWSFIQRYRASKSSEASRELRLLRVAICTPTSARRTTAQPMKHGEHPRAECRKHGDVLLLTRRQADVQCGEFGEVARQLFQFANEDAYGSIRQL